MGSIPSPSTQTVNGAANALAVGRKAAPFFAEPGFHGPNDIQVGPAAEKALRFRSCRSSAARKGDAGFFSILIGGGGS
jgi:hypothetical protein